MTDKANQIIEWSKSVTDRTKNEYDPIARQLFAINLIAALDPSGNLHPILHMGFDRSILPQVFVVFHRSDWDLS